MTQIQKDFFIGDGQREFRSLYDAKSEIIRDAEEKFEGEFYVDGYDGIEKFIAKRKVFDSYEGKDVIQGDKIDKYGHSRRETYTEDELFPINEFNKELEAEARKMDNDGWKLIYKAKGLGKKLKKEDKKDGLKK